MKNHPNKLDRSRRGDRTTRQAVILLSLSGLFVVLTLLLSALNDPSSTWLPFHIHSVLNSDYSQDPRGIPIARVQLSVIRDLLADLVGQGTTQPDERYAHVIDNLKTPVPTVTAMPGATIFVPTAMLSASPTLPTGFATATPGGFSSPTPTGTPTTTGTLLASMTPTQTLVFVYPTATRRPPTQPPTRTQPPAATNTSAPPPTQPPAPTATVRPTQPPPPTPQPTRPSYPPPYP